MNENQEQEYVEDPEIYEEMEIGEDEDISELIKEEIRQLMRERSKYSATSRTYMVYTQRITEASDQLRNAEAAENEKAQKVCAIRNKNTALLQTAGTVLGNIAGSTIGALINRSNVKTVVGCEENGGIINSKGMSFITKPRG